MAKLKVRSERKSLCHSNVAPGLKHHHRYGTTRESITYNQLRDYIQSDLQVCNGLNHADTSVHNLITPG